MLSISAVVSWKWDSDRNREWFTDLQQLHSLH
jgi:hypothetical protein